MTDTPAKLPRDFRLDLRKERWVFQAQVDEVYAFSLPRNQGLSVGQGKVNVGGGDLGSFFNFQEPDHLESPAPDGEGFPHAGLVELRVVLFQNDFSRILGEPAFL